MASNSLAHGAHALAVALSRLLHHCRDDCNGVIASDCGKAIAGFAASICCSNHPALHGIDPANNIWAIINQLFAIGKQCSRSVRRV
jgi:hypothetical protein